jgi:hypothetical protein
MVGEILKHKWELKYVLHYDPIVCLFVSPPYPYTPSLRASMGTWEFHHLYLIHWFLCDKIVIKVSLLQNLTTVSVLFCLNLVHRSWYSPTLTKTMRTMPLGPHQNLKTRCRVWSFTSNFWFYFYCFPHLKDLMNFRSNNCIQVLPRMYDHQAKGSSLGAYSILS